MEFYTAIIKFSINIIFNFFVTVISIFFFLKLTMNFFFFFNINYFFAVIEDFSVYFRYEIKNFKEQKYTFFKNNFFSGNIKDYSYLFSFNKNKEGLIKLGYNHGVFYPSPANLSYFWSFGSLAMLCLGIQILSGIFLAMHYVASVDFAFNSVEHIMRDVNSGWLIRYMHSNGASAFFCVVYFHIFRGLAYKSYSYSNKTVWFSGMLIFVLMMATAFIGYVLPWGQMSFWGATVITNLFSVIPVIGSDLVYWIWGGFSVSAATLNRFYSFHYLFPFIIAAAVGIHIFYLHMEGSSNPFTIENRDVNVFYLPLYPYFFIKDLIGVVIFSIVISYFIFFNPNVLGHSDNYIEANSMVTPEHIVPEWYFLPFYAILRSIPNKEIGIIAMGLSLVIFFFIPIINFFIDNNFFFKKNNVVFGYSNVYLSSLDIQVFRFFFITFFGWMVFFLGFIGARPVEYPYVNVGTAFTLFYFFVIVIISFFPSSDEYNFNSFSIKKKV